MSVYSKIYLVKDSFGQKAWASCEDEDDKIFLGVNDKYNKKRIFYSEAYELAEWCKSYEFEYKCIEKEYDFDELWNE